MGAKYRVPKLGAVGSIKVEDGATRGATLGVDVFDQSGAVASLATAAQAAAAATAAAAAQASADEAAAAAESTSGSLAAHEAAPNPHPGYLTQAEADALYDDAGTASAAVAAHEAATDPHPQYLTAAEGAAAYDPVGAAAAAQAAAVQRVNHTGTQVMATISDLPVLSSGVYTPTLTNVANVAASTAYASQWMRVGDVVTVSGRVDIDPTAASVASELGLSLPVASDFAVSNQCGGVACCAQVASLAAAIGGDAANDRARLQWVHTADTANRVWHFQFSYRVIP